LLDKSKGYGSITCRNVESLLLLVRAAIHGVSVRHWRSKQYQILAGIKEGAMSMWIYDDAGEMEEFQIYQREVRRLEGEYLEIRVLLRDAEEAFRADPDSEYLAAKIKYLRKRLNDLESQGPRLAADHPLEIALWAPPHG
jgi:hypothetical protein